MSLMLFMSPEHVAHMNGLLTADAASRTACAKFDRRWDIVYELAHGKETVWWTMRFDPVDGVSFTLQTPAQPGDVVFHGEYKAVIDAMRRMKAGDKDAVLPLTQSGNPDAMAVIGPAYSAAHGAAAIHTEFPSV
ncbi:MAG: hypothetical protein V4607_08020 [Pseudomonadota bacterium]